MILIITNNNDSTTYEVVEWLQQYHDSEITLICAEDEFKIIRFGKDELVIKISEKFVDLMKIETFWYRKGDIFMDDQLLNNPKFSSMKDMLYTEVTDLHNAIHKIVLEKNGIGNYFKGDLNRINTLICAAKFGLEIPEFCVTSNKTELETFAKKYNEIVIRTINQGIAYQQGEFHYMLYVNLLTGDQIEKLPSSFYPTLFMEYIVKEYEIRTFYLKNEFYSMAIFSQGNSKTEVDFRNYDDTLPNRTVPYKLPQDVEAKLLQLMQYLDLDTGSIDLIFSTDKKYYFLEINPVGQLGMVSKPCNYFFEREIALKLHALI